MENKNQILSRINDFLSNVDEIEFALLFGSFALDRENDISDVDIAIYVNREIDLIKYGNIISDLESTLERKVDLVVINNLYEKDPKLAYEIVTNHRTIFCRNSELLTKFKRVTFSFYFDTIALRNESNERMMNRILTKQFGKYNA